MKDKKKIIIIIAIILGLVLMVFVGSLIFSISKTDSKKIENEYEKLNNKEVDGKKYPQVNIPSDNIIKYTSVDEILGIFNDKKNAVIYFGYPSCVYCRSAVQVLVDTASTTLLDTIYYLDTEKNNIKDDKLLNVLGDELVLTEDGTKDVPLPLVIFVAKGKIVSYNKGTLFSQDDPYEKLDEYQIQGLSEIYKYGINDVLTR